MKVFALVLLCALVAVQARNTGLTNRDGERGDGRATVHLRYAIGSTGLLQTCTGSLISNRWVLTAASCVNDYRFGWYRYGAWNVIKPALVTEANTAAARPNIDPSNKLALLDTNRNVNVEGEEFDYVPLSSEFESSAIFCGYSDANSDSPGEELSCRTYNLVENDGSIIASGAEAASRFDIGGALVTAGNRQFAVLTEAGNGDNAGTFTPVDLEWVTRVTGITF